MNVGEVFSVEAYARFVALRDSVLPSRGVLDLARGWRPRPSRWGRGRRGTRCDLNYLVGAWAGDGSVAVMTRQRRRQAARAEARKAERARVAAVRASQREIEERRHEAALEAALEGSVQERLDAAFRGARWGGA